MPTLTFQSEEERLQHPIGKLIPLHLWRLLGKALTHDMQMFMRPSLTDEEVEFLKKWISGRRFETQPEAPLICFALGHPELDDDALLKIFREKFKYAESDIMESAIILGRNNMLDKIDINISIPTVDLFITAAKGGNIDTIKKLCAANPKKIEEMVKNPEKIHGYNNFIARVATVAARYGHLDILKSLEKLDPETMTKLIAEGSFTSDYDIYADALCGESINVLNWLHEKTPEVIQKRVSHELSGATRVDEQMFHDNLDTLKWLQAQSPAAFQALIIKNGYRMFEMAASKRAHLFSCASK